jgi:hypothetical protein
VKVTHSAGLGLCNRRFLLGSLLILDSLPERYRNSEPPFLEVKPVTLFASFKSFTFRLWDAQRGRLVGYGQLGVAREQQRNRVNLD